MRGRTRVISAARPSGDRTTSETTGECQGDSGGLRRAQGDSGRLMVNQSNTGTISQHQVKIRTPFRAAQGNSWDHRSVLGQSQGPQVKIRTHQRLNFNIRIAQEEKKSIYTRTLYT